MAAAKRHRHVVEVVEMVEEVKEVKEVNQPAVVETILDQPEMDTSPQDMGLLGVNIEQSTGRGGNKMMMVVIIIIVAGVVTGGWLAWQINRDKQLLAGGPTPTPSVQVETATPTPEVSPTPEIKLADVKVQVLNGSGIKGEAGKVADLLKKAGFTNVVTGNASKFDFEDIQLDHKLAVEPIYNALEKALTEGGYKVEEGDGLEDSDKFDARIVVGEKSE